MVWLDRGWWFGVGSLLGNVAEEGIAGVFRGSMDVVARIVGGERVGLVVEGR